MADMPEPLPPWQHHGKMLRPKVKPSKTRMFECSLCNTAFNSRDKLKKHLAFKHDGEVFDCNICQAKFASKTELTKHISIVHELVFVHFVARI